MLWIDPTPLGFSSEALATRAREREITLGAARIVIHHQVAPQAVDDLIALVGDLKREYASGPSPPPPPPALSDEEMARNRERSRGRWELGIEPPSSTRRSNNASIYGSKK
jgi:threonine aldolase